MKELRRSVETRKMTRVDVAMLTHTSIESDYNQSEGIEAGNRGVEYKEKKVFVISNAHTVVDPRAVVCKARTKSNQQT